MSYPPPPGGNPDPYGQQQPPYGQQPNDPYGQQPQGYPQYGEQQYPTSGAPQYPTSGPPQYPTSGAPGQYGQQPYQPGYAAPQVAGTNMMAILSLVFAFVFSPVGIVLGHIAKKQIKQTGEQGDGLATAGLVISYIFTGIYVVACCIWGVAVIGLAGAGSTSGY